MKEPLISVIIPIYNKEKYIEKCINSITQQTHKNLEIILVNDGSKDNSLNICKELASKDNRIIVLDKSNGGAASARNLGLKHATGEYIGFCDADDYLDLDMYQTLLSIMIKNNLKIIDCTSRVVDEKNKLIWQDCSDSNLIEQSPETAIEQIFLRKGNVSLCTRLIKKEVISGITIPEGKRVEDFYFTICLLTKVDKNVTYNYPFYNCVTSGNSVTRSSGGSIYLDAIYFYDLAVEYLKPFNYKLEDSQRYYLLKMYYLLAISLTKKEGEKYKEEVFSIKRNLKAKKGYIKTDKYLTSKEKRVLNLACFSFALTRLLFLIKDKVKGKK